MLIKYSGKYVKIHFNMKITFYFRSFLFLAQCRFLFSLSILLILSLSFCLCLARILTPVSSLHGVRFLVGRG